MIHYIRFSCVARVWWPLTNCGSAPKTILDPEAAITYFFSRSKSCAMSSPQTKEFLRQSREKLRRSSTETRVNLPVTVHVSPKSPAISRTPNSERIQRLRDGEEEYVKFVCKEGEEIFVPESVCFTSGFVNPIFWTNFLEVWSAVC